jgi:hypothetical protein
LDFAKHIARGLARISDDLIVTHGGEQRVVPGVFYVPVDELGLVQPLADGGIPKLQINTQALGDIAEQDQIKVNGVDYIVRHIVADVRAGTTELTLSLA